MGLMLDSEMDNRQVNYPVNTPHTKDKIYCRRIYDENFHGMKHMMKLWEGVGTLWDLC